MLYQLQMALKLSMHVLLVVSSCVKAPLPNHFGATTDASISFKIIMIQFTVLVNNATTGHKLQGQTKENLVISVWSQKKLELCCPFKSHQEARLILGPAITIKC